VDYACETIGAKAGFFNVYDSLWDIILSSEWIQAHRIMNTYYPDRFGII
jgi:hypothetical protein